MAKVYIGATFAVLQVLGAIRGTEYYNASDYASQHAREMARQKMLDKYRAKYRKELELSEYMESPAFSKGARIYYTQPPSHSNAVGSKIVYTDKRIDKCFTYADAPYDDSEWWYTITVTVDGKQVIKIDRAITEVDIPAGEHTFRVDVKSHYQNDPAERLGEYKIDKEMNTKTVEKVKVEEGENYFSIYHSVTFGIDGVGTYYDKNNCYNIFVVQAPVRAKTTAYMASLELFTKRHRCDLYEYDIPFPTNEYFPEGWDEGEESQEIAESAGIIVDLYLQETALHGIDNVALLTPLRQKTETGVNALNELIRDKVNPPAPSKAETPEGRAKKYREGDKVMQIKNFEDVNNGDIGYIRKIVNVGGDTVVLIDFGDGRFKEYDLSEMDMVDLGYASTVHKSQGSEYSTVIINLQCAHHIMLTRPLIYTAITRGKSKVIIVGERKAQCIAIKRTDTDKRGTCLAKRMQDILNSKE